MLTAAISEFPTAITDYCMGIYIRVRLLWENFERASPKLVLGMPTKKSPKFF